MEIESTIRDIRTQAEKDLKESQTAQDIEGLKVKYLGKKGLVQNLMLSLKDCPPERRPQFGKLINELKVELTDLLDSAYSSFDTRELNKRLAEESIDVTLPGRGRFLGKSMSFSRC